MWHGGMSVGGKKVLWVKMVHAEREEDMIQWKDVMLFKAGVPIQESAALSDVRAYASNLVFLYFHECMLVPGK